MSKDSINSWLSELHNNAKAESLKRLKRLATDTVNRKVQFLCGAGMSKGANLPLASDLVVMMASEMLGGEQVRKPYPEAIAKLESLYPLEAVAEAYGRNDSDRSRLTELLRREFGSAVGHCHAGHSALDYFANQRLIDKVYTTNFDKLLEEGFSTRGCAIVDDNADQIETEQEKGMIPVLHLHGTLEHGYMIQESHTYSLNTPLAKVMQADMVAHRFVWIGYKLTDVDLRTIYLSMREILTTSGLAKRPYVIHPLTLLGESQELEWRLADQVWDSRGITFIPGAAESFLPALQDQVRHVAAEHIAEAIVKKKGADPKDQLELDQVWQDARTLAQKTLLGDEIDAIHEVAKGLGM